MDIKIPKQFNLFGQTIKVEKSHTLVSDNGNLGEAHIGKNKIILQNDNNERLTKEQTEWIFLHELIHTILFFMGKEELTTDEVFVDTFAQLLHQAFKTMKYEEKKNGK